MIELILSTFGIMLIGQLLHQIVKLKKAHRKFQGDFRVWTYLKSNVFVVSVNAVLILLLACANVFVPIITGNLALLLAGFALDSTIISIFGGNGKK